MADQSAPSPFLDELAGTRSHDEVRPSRMRPTAASAASSAARAAPTVAAEVGLEVGIGGFEGVIVEVGETAVLVSVGRARMSAAYGSEVRVGGRTLRLARPGDERLVEALKAWRRETASRDKVPAYVVLSDKDVEGIAERSPRSLEDLAACRGIGATRLERYGDELLAVIEGVVA